MTDKEYLDLAKAVYEEDGRIEFDAGATVSRSEEGAYVQGWVWIDAGLKVEE